MERYLVQSNHTTEDCHHVMEQFIYHGFILNFDWGCEAGVHTGWAIIEAENNAQALLAVPPQLRARANAVLVRKITPQEIQADHD
jgi:hypothetical protein